MIYDSRDGSTVEVLDDALIIRRNGFTSFLAQGIKGEKRIPFSSITSVQFKEPDITTGYIQFGIMGGVESRDGVFDATRDENTVLFVKRTLSNFRELRRIVEGRIGTPAQKTSVSAISAASFSEELTRIADLRDRGVLTDDEFAEEKARLQVPRNLTAALPLSQPDTHAPSSQPTEPEIFERTSKSPKGSTGKKVGIGCLVLIGLLVILSVLGTIAGPKNGDDGAGNLASSKIAEVESSADPAPQNESTSVDNITSGENTTQKDLTPSQINAVRSAEQYLGMSGFSRRGLIQQLSSDAGNGYDIADAEIAVDSLNTDWNENVAKSAKQYVEMSGFSCKSLIKQLSSSSGEKYTVAQATYGAHQAGAC